MKNVLNIATSSIIVLFYTLFQPIPAYGTLPAVMANIGLIPVIAIVLRLFKLKDISTAIITLVIYQTWNMFLNPYLWEDKIVAVHRVIREEHIPLMSVFSCLSVWAIYLGYITFQNRKSKISPFFNNRNIPMNNLRRLTLVAIILGFGIGIFQFLLSFMGIHISFIGMIGDMMPALVLCIFSIYYLRGGHNIFLISVVILYTAYSFVYYIGGTLFIYSIILVSAPLAVYIVERKKVPIIPIIIVAIALIPVYMSRHDYRREGLYSSGTERLEIGMRILKDEYVNFSLEKNKKRLEESDEESNVDNRFEGVSYLATVVHCVEDRDYPYQYGKTFIWLPTLVVPRMFLPMRPSMNMGDEWAVYYRVKDRSWKASINFPMLVEFYANFGWFGMVVLSFLQGWIIAFICRKFNDGRGDINLIFMVFLLPRFIIVEANITLSYGLILQVVFLIWVYKKFFQAKTEPTLQHRLR